jgi:hypothetical protein
VPTLHQDQVMNWLKNKINRGVLGESKFKSKQNGGALNALNPK